MCFFRGLNEVVLSLNASADVLSPYIDIWSIWLRLPKISLWRFRNQIASCVVADIAIYSASVVDSATVGCFLEFQVIARPCNKKTYPVTDRLSTASPAQSASAHTNYYYQSYVLESLSYKNALFVPRLALLLVPIDRTSETPERDVRGAETSPIALKKFSSEKQLSVSTTSISNKSKLYWD